MLQIIGAVDNQLAAAGAPRSEILDAAFIYFFQQFRTFVLLILKYLAEFAFDNGDDNIKLYLQSKTRRRLEMPMRMRGVFVCVCFVFVNASWIYLCCV